MNVVKLSGRVSIDVVKLSGRVSIDVVKLSGRVSIDVVKLSGRVSIDVVKLSGRVSIDVTSERTYIRPTQEVTAIKRRNIEAPVLAPVLTDMCILIK